MSFVKRFGDFCVGFAAFASGMYLFRQYMSTDFKEIEGIADKLKFFFSTAAKKDYRYYLVLLFLLLLSFGVSLAFHRLPWIAFTVSALPIVQIIAMFDADKIYERPMVYVVLAAIHSSCCLFECIRRDREDRGRRSALALDGLGLFIAAFCGYILYISKDIANVEFKYITLIKKTLYTAVVYYEADLKLLGFVALAFCVAVALRLIFRDLYYLDAAISIVPAVFCIYRWHSGSFPVFASVLVALSVAYAIGRISVMLCCRPKALPEIK